MYLLWDLIGSLGNLCLLCLARVVSLGNYFGCYFGSDRILESYFRKSWFGIAAPSLLYLNVPLPTS